MNYILRYQLTASDIGFLNETTIEFEVHNTHGLKVETQFDSGWCDMNTGARIIGTHDRAVFKNVSEQEYTLLLLKFGSRLKELTNGFKEIYNIAEQHNASPTVVADSETII
jgi:hypothetical protein